jgi:hypothetical protein
VIAHDWRECRPVLLDLSDLGDPPTAEDKRAFDAVQLVWLTCSEQDRRLFHEFCCLNRRSTAHFEAMERISAAIRGLLPE